MGSICLHPASYLQPALVVNLFGGAEEHTVLKAFASHLTEQAPPSLPSLPEPSGAMVLPTLQGQALLSPPSPASWNTHCFPYAPEASPHSPTLMEQVTELPPHTEHAQAHSLNSLT